MKFFTAFFLMLIVVALPNGEAQAQGTIATTDSLPARGLYKNPAGDTARYTNGFKISSINLHNVNPQGHPPALGITQTYSFNAQMDFDMVPGGHQSSLPANCFMRATHSTDSATTRFFDTEMLSLNLS